MPAIVQCEVCGRIASARVIEDDPSTNAFECEPEWRDEDDEWAWVSVNGKLYTFNCEDVNDTKLFNQRCTHEDFEILEVNHNDLYYD